jgi:hypothetical protein
MELYNHFSIISRKFLLILQVIGRRFLAIEAFFIGETKDACGEIIPAKEEAQIIKWNCHAKAKIEHG